MVGLWPDFNLAFWTGGATQRRPLRRLSSWHLALSLAAGGISGTVTSRSGRQLVVKGDTFKEKTSKVEFDEDADGNISERRILTDRFVPAVMAWDVTPDSPDKGRLFMITSTPAVGAHWPYWQTLGQVKVWSSRSLLFPTRFTSTVYP